MIPRNGPDGIMRVLVWGDFVAGGFQVGFQAGHHFSRARMGKLVLDLKAPQVDGRGDLTGNLFLMAEDELSNLLIGLLENLVGRHQGLRLLVINSCDLIRILRVIQGLRVYQNFHQGLSGSGPHLMRQLLSVPNSQSPRKKQAR